MLSLIKYIYKDNTEAANLTISLYAPCDSINQFNQYLCEVSFVKLIRNRSAELKVQMCFLHLQVCDILALHTMVIRDISIWPD